MDIYHVYPIDDLILHNTKLEKCDCNPIIIRYPNAKIIIHNAWDQREIWETRDENSKT